MADTVIQLGTFTFEGLEIPEHINFGGEQHVNVHELIGGTRIIDILGHREDDISWSGLMLGPTSLTRALELDQLRIAGTVLTFTWFSLNYNVIIEHFTARTQRYYQVEYDISLKVVANQLAQNQSQQIIGIDKAIQNDLALATTLAASIGDPTISTQMQTLNTTANNVTSYQDAGQADVDPTNTALDNLLTTVDNKISGLSDTVTADNSTTSS